MTVWVLEESFPGPRGHLERDLMASACLGSSRNLIHMGTTDTSVWIAPPKPIKEQTLCQYSLQMRPELWTEGWDERERAERDCWLTSVVCSKSVHRGGETQAQEQSTHTYPPRQSQKDSCQLQLSLNTVQCVGRGCGPGCFSPVIAFSVVLCNDWDPPLSTMKEWSTSVSVIWFDQHYPT